MANATSYRSPASSRRRTKDLTPLQRHAAFFDPEGTGTVTLGQTYAGLTRLGVRRRWKWILSFIINVFLGYLTQRKLSLKIAVHEIASGKHPYDTGVFDDAGGIDDKAFEELVAAATGGALTKDEMNTLIRSRGNRRPQMGKVAGSMGRWFSAREVSLLFCLAADTTKDVLGTKEPAITPRTLRRFYDGTLLHTIARRRRILDARAG